jgi:hypothetical protein
VTRSELITAWSQRLDKNTSSLDDTTKARVIAFLNQRQRQLLTLPGLMHLRNTTVTFASVASQASYVLPNIAKIHRIYDPTNQRVLYEMSQQRQRLIDPIPITGTPESFIWLGRQVVRTHPSDASELFVKSTSASDVGTAYVQGVITGNYPRTASVTMSGTTAVSLSSSITTWEQVNKFYVSTAAAGTITLREDSGSGTELATITIGQTSTDYWGFTLWPTPSSVITYSADIERAVTDLAQDTDVPVLPEDFHDVLLLGAVMDEYQRLNDQRWSVAEAEYTKRVEKLQYWLYETPTSQPFSLTRGYQRPSQLGSWFPSGT